MKTVTVDFDGTLTKPEVQEYITELLKDPEIQVFILTSRFCELTRTAYKPNPTNEELWKLISYLGISERNVIFTRFTEKSSILNLSEAIWHLDDDQNELYFIETYSPKTLGINVNDEDWKEKCISALK